MMQATGVKKRSENQAAAVVTAQTTATTIEAHGSAVKRDSILNGLIGSTNANSRSEPITQAQAEPVATKLVLQEWSVSYPFSGFYLEQIDLDAAAAALVQAGVASSVYVADGSLYWLKDGDVRNEIADLRYSECEHSSTFRLPKDIDGWAAHGAIRALLYRFSEKQLFSPMPGPQHEYLRATMEPSLLGFGDEHIVISPTLKLYKTGVFTITYEVVTPEEGIGVTELVEKYVNLFARYCDEAWVPHAIADIGATTKFYIDADHPDDRESNLAMVTLMRTAAEEMIETVEIEDFKFSLYPAHRPLDDFLSKYLHAQSETQSTAKTIDAPEITDAANEQCDEYDSDDASVHNYNLSDMYENAEYAVRATIDPSSGGSFCIRRELKPSLTLGNYWQCRPQVIIERFDHQPATASAIREKFGDDLGRIMVRVPDAPASLARTQLGDSLRPFEDHSIHINSTISLCVYASNDSNARSSPAALDPIERACTFELIDYLAMRCHQLDQRATLATSASEARAVRMDLVAAENLARTAFRAGELTDVVLAAWGRLRLPLLVQEVREKVSLAAEAAAERAEDHSARLNVADRLDPNPSHGRAVDFAIITALEEERDAVLRKLPSYKKLDKTADDIRTYYEAEISTQRADGTSYRIVVTCLCDTGPQLATAAASSVVARWHPTQVLLVGIACGIAGETEYGDILVPKQVADYSAGKLLPDGNREVRWEVHRASANLLDSATHLATAEWMDLIQVSRPSPGEIVRRAGVVASGGDVISNDAIIAAYRSDWPKLIGIEMEAGGTATGLHQTSARPEFLMIKAVSDHGKDKKDPAVLPWRAYACEVAAAFAVGLIRSGPRPATVRSVSYGHPTVHDQYAAESEGGAVGGVRADNWRAEKRDMKQAEVAGEVLVAALQFLDGLSSLVSIVVRARRGPDDGDHIDRRAARRTEVEAQWASFAAISNRFVDAIHLAETYLPEEANETIKRVWLERASILAWQTTFFATPERAAFDFFREGFGSIPERRLAELRDECRRILRPIVQLSAR
jgi:nucleoside phosphorylase